MKKIALLVAAILTLALLTASIISQSKKSKTVSKGIAKQAGQQSSESLSVANEFRVGTVFAVDSANNLQHFHVSTPGTIDGTVAISNLQPGEQILGIDFRPATGQLYGLGSSSRLYVINLVTGVASSVGGGPFTPALNGTDFGFDFNPTVDRIRVVSDAEQNLRLNPDTGAVQATDAFITPPGNLVGSAYTNNFAGATTTTLYGIDSNTDQLVIQNPPNDGTITPVGALGFDTGGSVGFDIQAGSGTAYASLTSPVGTTSSFFAINLSSGVATLVGTIGGGTTIRGIAVVSGPETMFGVTTSNNLVRFESNNPGAIVSSVPITGLQSGEGILGIDFRPANGQLYGLGSTSRLYVIDTSNGVATQVGSGTFSTPLNGTDFGFDFNPTVDLIRVVSDAEQNMRLNPNTGAVFSSDPAVNPPSNVVAAAYNNNFAGATITTLYDIDSNSDLLLIQSPPNAGTLSAVGPLNVNTTGLTGFDIAPTGLAFGSLTLPAAVSTGLYRIDLTSGNASSIGQIGGGETIRDVAVRITTEVIYGVTQTGGGTFNLISFNAASPTIIQTLVGITGLQAGETIRGIDFRPANGVLFALGSTSRIYTVDLTTGAATAVNGPFTPALSGASFGFDFNPTVDRIRVVSDNEQNLRLNPNTGLVSNTDLALNPAGNIVAAAYTNNFAGATSTTLYDIDAVTDRLLIQSPPNDGTLTTVGPLGVDISNSVGFDIASGSGVAYLSAYPPGTIPGLYRVNLGTGAATLIGNVNVTDTLIGIAVLVSGTTIAGVDTAAVYAPPSGTWFLRNSNTPGIADTVFGYGPGGTPLPIKGDWDGDGDDTVGIYEPSTGGFFLRNSNSPGAADLVFTFGVAGANFLPITGDWDGDGDDTIGIYDTSTGTFFLRNTNSGGSADVILVFGVGGAIPLAGDWNNDNTDTIGIYAPASGTFFLRNSNSNGPADITPFSFGAPGATPLAGDWNGDGTDSIGVYYSTSGAWFLSNGFTGSADFIFGYGAGGVTGLVGDWDGR